MAAASFKKSATKHTGQSPAKAEDDVDDSESVESGVKGEAKKDMKNVTNFVNEELAQRQVDADKLGKSLTFLQDAAKNHKQKISAKAPGAAPLNKQDVEFIMTQMQVSKLEAEKALRHENGELVSALCYLVAK